MVFVPLFAANLATMDRQMGSQGRKESGRKKYCLYLGPLADFTSSPTKLCPIHPKLKFQQK